MDRPLVIRPELPAVNMSHIAGLLERDELITLDGEIVALDKAESTDLVAWMIAMRHVRDLARRMDERCGAIMLDRCAQQSGPIVTEYGTATQSVSRGPVSGIASARIRDILEGAEQDGLVPVGVADNLAPLKAHVTPAKLADYIEVGAPERVATDLAEHLPDKRRTVKIEERLG
jgi:hypothetical protein